MHLSFAHDYTQLKTRLTYNNSKILSDDNLACVTITDCISCSSNGLCKSCLSGSSLVVSTNYSDPKYNKTIYCKINLTLTNQIKNYFLENSNQST